MRKLFSTRFLAVPFAGLMLAGMSSAATLYTAPPDQSGGSDMNSFLEADDVTFGSAVTLTQIKFWSFQTNAADYAGSIAWSFNLNAAGVPGASVASGSATPSAIATGNSGFGLNEFSYTFAVNVPLGAGTYWLVLHNGPTNATPATDFYWGWSNSNAGNSQSQDLSVGGSPWLSNFSELAFELQGSSASVPEPASFVLLGAGLLGAFAARARKKS